MIRTRTTVPTVLFAALAGCKGGPNYQRPALDVPGQYRGTAPALPQQAPSTPFAEMKWPDVYQDETLQQLIKEALTNNYNVRIAATAIMQAQANLGITRANQFPSLAGSFAIQNERNSGYPGAPTFDTAGLSLSYIVDFWGQYRRATEAARATLLSTQYAQNVVRITLIDSVATAYFQLRAFDEQLDVSPQN